MITWPISQTAAASSLFSPRVKIFLSILKIDMFNISASSSFPGFLKYIFPEMIEAENCVFGERSLDATCLSYQAKATHPEESVGTVDDVSVGRTDRGRKWRHDTSPGA